MKYEIIKGSAKDFEGAPEWAKYLVGIPGSSDRAFVESICLGGRHQFTDSLRVSQNSDLHEPENHYIIAERRPITEPVWDGEGAPCVGQKVMTKSGEGIIDYVGSGVIVYSNNDGQWSVRCDSLDYSLSSIRSPEDVARDEAGLAIYHAINWNSEGELVSPSRMEDYKKAYDAIAAGKIPCVTKTPTVSELMRVTEYATREDCEAIVKMLSGN